MKTQQRWQICLHFILLLGVAALIAACSPSAAAPAPTLEIDVGDATIATASEMVSKSCSVQEGDPAPDFRYTMPDGTTHQLSDFQGQPVMVNFWATWCLPCLEELPALQQAAETHPDQNLVVLAVNRNEMPDAIARFATEHPFTLPMIANTSGDIGDCYGVTGIPQTFFVDSSGAISNRFIGVLNEDLINQRLDTLGVGASQ